ncbi:protein FAM91A1-like [Abrus precatorius]|uniref:Protein FAM91A1-like n=1 Tax=Abrus precatorius TaxID=3816 RepID=A0A8B8JQ46_ABRPR|nr:protein FAM91A1-like [Abrus precatorius]
MQRAPVTVEEQLLEKAIEEECAWENLPRRLQPIVPSKEEWHKRIIECCIKKRLKWKSCFARKVCKENEYYEDMMRYLRRNLALYPYHLAEYVCRVMRVSSFRYYCDMIFEVMKNEQSYDRIPNFSAADALRLTGIGRNEFIDIMNKCRSKKIMWKLNKSIAKELLPTQPVDIPVEPWWGVCVVNLTLEEFKKLSKEEMATIDKVCKEEEANSFSTFEPDIVRGLCRRGLVYFDVPVYPDDRFKVSRLEGFVSNREQSYEDPIEELLYAVFVVSNENATVSELATTLQADLSQLQAAASFVCRLGWATKVMDPESIIGDSSILASPTSLVNDEDTSLGSQGSENMLFDNDSTPQGDTPGSATHGPRSAYTRVAFIVDANITSYLMMGSVSPGLKSHAVTLYEAGKLGHASIADLCKDLSTLEGATYEGELQEFANHAFSLRCVLECLQSGGIATNKKEEGGVDKLSMITSSNDESSSSVISEISWVENSGNSGVTEAVINNEDSENLMEAAVCTEPVPCSLDDETHSITSEDGGSHFQEADKLSADFHGNEKLAAVEGLDVGAEMIKRKKKYRVEILRSESLASLAPVTLNRLFLRDYDILVSIVPLSHSSFLPRPTGPVHFGPPTYSSMSPWMKLVLYSTAGSGPLSVVLMKGQCLRLLPAPLVGCEKALIWSWDGSTIGGLGRKLEGNLVKGSILLHCLNSLLRHSAVLVLPLNKCDLNESGKVITLDIPLPLKNSDGSVASVGKELGLYEEESSKLNSLLTNLANKTELWTVGYIRLLKLCNGSKSDQFSSKGKYEWVPLSVEFGMPLSSPALCNHICRRIVSSELLQSDSFSEHHGAMHNLRKRLRDICDEYQSTGPTAKLIYQKEQASGQPMNCASRGWNPLMDPSSPISGALNAHQRLKLATRQRCQTELLSFDGSVIRSYAITPANEAGTRPIKEASEGNTIKTEPEEIDSKEAILPGVNLIFDGSKLLPFDIAACLQARQPISLIIEAAAVSASVPIK